MSKIRVYEFAKEYGKSSKDIIELLARYNITVKNHMSMLEDDARQLLEELFKPPSERTLMKPRLPERSDKPASPPPAAGAAAATKQEQPRQEPVNQPSSRGDNRSAAERGIQAPARQGTPPAQPRTEARGTAQQPKQQQQRPRTETHGTASRTGADRIVQSQQQQRPRTDTRGTVQPQQQQQRPRTETHGAAQPRQQQQQQQQRQQRPSVDARGTAQQPQQQQQHRPRTDTRGTVQPQQQQQRPRTDARGTLPHGPRLNIPEAPVPQPPGAKPSDRKPLPAKREREEFSEREKALPPRGIYGKGSHKARQKPAAVPQQPAAPAKPKVVKLSGPITVKDLAGKLGREVSEIIKKLMSLGVLATINQEIDADTAAIVATEFGATVEEAPVDVPEAEIPEIEDDPATLVFRPPVVTIMGHVDHGKTSLLDVIRQTNITAQEAGGITQHIGAYQVVHQGKKIVFLDTPGHEAFTAMRARGAQVTDIAILVVAADDGVMPQTIEAINHAKVAKVPIIVAINKMDRPEANPDRVKQQLTEHGLVPEDWGGDTICVPVSAHKKTGLTELLEMILLVAEMSELKANPNRPAQGTIIEAQLDKGRGPVATVLVQKGTLRIGDAIVAGATYGKVRAMLNDRGEKVKKAEPSTPVEVLGLNDVPQAGDILQVVPDEKTARYIGEKRAAKKRSEELQQGQKVSLDDLFKQIQEGNVKDLNIVIKADVQGSVEALRQALENQKNKDVRVNIIHGGVGAITESDIMLASASNAIVIGFNVRPDVNARKAAEAEKVDIRTYRVIYDAIEDVQAALTGMLEPEYREATMGRAEVRAVFRVPKAGVVAGSYVTEGKITSNAQVRVIRNGIVIYEGKIESLRRFKDDVREVTAGYECGIGLEKFGDIKEGDIIEAFSMEMIKPKA